jgi:hypothetical protein
MLSFIFFLNLIELVKIIYMRKYKVFCGVRIFLSVIFLTIITGSYINGQQSLPGSKDLKDKPDTIVKLGGKKILCYILKLNSNSVSYTLWNSKEELEMGRKEIEKVIFKNGRKEVYNKPVLTMIDKDNWQSVLITDKEAEVEGLYKMAAIKANAASGSRSGEAAKASATIRMQKKAAGLGALIVLITHSQMQGGYGETPGWALEGIAFSDTPPQDTAAVNKAIRDMIERRSKVKDKKGK